LLALSLLIATAGPAMSTELVDPTKPADALPVEADAPIDETQTELKLNSILTTDGTRVAIINGQRLQVGDRIEGLVVGEIGTSSVRLGGPEGDRRLSLFGPVKKPSRK